MIAPPPPEMMEEAVSDSTATALEDGYSGAPGSDYQDVTYEGGSGSLKADEIGSKEDQFSNSSVVKEDMEMQP